MTPTFLARRALSGDGDHVEAVEAAIREAVEHVADACYAVLQMDLSNSKERALAMETLADALEAVDYKPTSEFEPEEDDGADSPVVLG